MHRDPGPSPLPVNQVLAFLAYLFIYALLALWPFWSTCNMQPNAFLAFHFSAVIGALAQSSNIFAFVAPNLMPLWPTVLN